MLRIRRKLQTNRYMSLPTTFNSYFTRMYQTHFKLHKDKAQIHDEALM